MATHSSVLAWRIPGTGEPGGLPSMGSHRVGHDWSDLAAVAAAADTMIRDGPLAEEPLRDLDLGLRIVGTALLIDRVFLISPALPQ